MKIPEMIKKGLECCSTISTRCIKECPYKEDGSLDALIPDALTYIKQLEAKIAEYEKAIEDGRMVMLPCKPGDDVYWLDDSGDEIAGWCVKCDQGGVGAVVVLGKDDFAIMSSSAVRMNDFTIEKIGERWTYLTEEDAQNAILAMGTEDKNDDT